MIYYYLKLFLLFIISRTLQKKKKKITSQNLPFIRSETMAILINPSIDMYQEPTKLSLIKFFYSQES